MNTVWHDAADVCPLADRHTFEEEPDPGEFHVLVRLNGLDAVPDFHVVPRAELVRVVTTQYDAWIREPKADGTPSAQPARDDPRLR